MNDFFKRPLVLKILSLLLAVFIWVYVINVNDPETDTDISSVPVMINTVDSTPYRNGLAITEGLSQTIDVKIRGRHSSVAAYDTSQITATVDISSITEAGTYSLPVTVYVPGDDVWLVNHTPTKLTYTFSNIITADVPVTVVVTGEAAPSYIVDTTAVSPQSVKVTGPASEVNYVSHAQINVDISNISTDTTVASDIVLINKDNAPMRSKHISCNTAQAEASVTFLKKKTVELTFETAAAEGQQGDVVCDIVPSHIEIAGKADIVDNISTINVGTIDVNSVSPGEEIVLDIVLPDGVRLVSGNASAKITVHSAQTEIATITSVPIDLSGMEQLSEFKNEVVVFSDKIDITVSGPTDAVNDISKDDIAVIADFSGIQDEVGIYDIPINIALDTDSSVTVSGMYTIAVEVKEKDNADSE